ncbi:hypothetical protein [Burkholderia territorii]|uniref:ATP dependent DNA ligase n=1 Tax=Burkholderia territorii TaxID=1503055 RepID=UPI000A8B39D9|nr:hypothetical protein [Burkholderia territorii]
MSRKRAPFASAPEPEADREFHWLKPELVAEVAFIEWTPGGQLRHPSFQSLRADKPARTVTREAPVADARNSFPTQHGGPSLFKLPKYRAAAIGRRQKSADFDRHRQPVQILLCHADLDHVAPYLEGVRTRATRSNRRD